MMRDPERNHQRQQLPNIEGANKLKRPVVLGSILYLIIRAEAQSTLYIIMNCTISIYPKPQLPSIGSSPSSCPCSWEL